MIVYDVQVMENALFVIVTYVQQLLSEYVTSVTMVHMLEGVLYAAVLVCQMHIIVTNALFKRKM